MGGVGSRRLRLRRGAFHLYLLKCELSERFTYSDMKMIILGNHQFLTVCTNFLLRVDAPQLALAPSIQDHRGDAQETSGEQRESGHPPPSQQDREAGRAAGGRQ